MATKLDPTAAPFAPSTAEPLSPLDLVTPPLDDDKPPVSLSRLPVELKEQSVAGGSRVRLQRGLFGGGRA